MTHPHLQRLAKASIQDLANLIPKWSQWNDATFDNASTYINHRLDQVSAEHAYFYLPDDWTSQESDNVFEVLELRRLACFHDPNRVHRVQSPEFNSRPAQLHADLQAMHDKMVCNLNLPFPHFKFGASFGK